MKKSEILQWLKDHPGWQSCERKLLRQLKSLEWDGKIYLSKPPKRGSVQAKYKYETSWLHGMYPNGEIHTGLGYVAVNEPDYFFQGDSGEKVIDEIAAIRERNPEMTNEDAFDHWINTML